MPLETCQASDCEFFGRIHLLDLGGVTISRISSDAQYVQRSRKSILSEEAASLIFIYQVSGTCRIFQHGQNVLLKRGQVAFLDSDQPYELRFPNTFDQLVLQVPKALIRANKIGLHEDAGLRAVHSNEPAAQTEFIFEDVWKLYFSASVAARSNHLVELLGQLALPFQETSSGFSNGLNAKQFAHLDRAKRFILSNLKNDELSASDIAAECGVSPRYLRSLFASEANKMSHWMTRQRLECARMDLECVAGRDSFISAVAYRWGFPDHSNFCRKFKAAYGVSPRQWQKGEAQPAFHLGAR